MARSFGRVRLRWAAFVLGSLRDPFEHSGGRRWARRRGAACSRAYPAAPAAALYRAAAGLRGALDDAGLRHTLARFSAAPGGVVERKSLGGQRHTRLVGERAAHPAAASLPAAAQGATYARVKLYLGCDARPAGAGRGACG